MQPNFDERNKKLEELGNELTNIQYDFKIKEISSEEYWKKKINEFERYHKKTIEYFSQAYSLIKEVDSDQSGFFILRLSKLKQLGLQVLENMEKVRQNPNIMDSKDKQQSKWTVEQREHLLSLNKECRDHEKNMNVFFREFYENNLR